MERSRSPVPDIYQKKHEQSWQRSGRAGSPASPRKFKDQDFSLLRDHCLSHRRLFEDDTFPAHASSIGNVLSEDQLHQLNWKRPTNIHKNPSLIVDGVSRFDIVQGEIGDCWVLAALGSLTLQRQFLENVIPDGQGFKNNYAGIFHFRLWYFGDWVDVVIDDRLPFLNDYYLSVSPRSQNEFWPSLLEKAYAKLRGSYTKLHWGYISEALVDFTGGIQMSFNLQNPPDYLYEIVKTAAESNCLMGCTTHSGSTGKNIELKNGIISGHAYTVTSAREIPYRDGKACLIRIWNPWGHGEWNGAWSDRSVVWDQVPKQYKSLHKDKDDGEFWMSYHDFKVNFSYLHICNCTPTFLDFGEPSNAIWSMDMHVNQWNQGGSIHHTGALSRNPQYPIQVVEPDMKNYNTVVSLMQKPGNYRSNTQLQPIGFQIVRDGTPLYTMRPVKTRDITECYRLSPGSYIIIPTTSQEDPESEFVLRIFQRNQNNIRQPNARHSPIMPKDMPKWNQDNSYESIFLRYANQSPYLDASQLQRILNEVVLKDLMASQGSRDGFSFDSCRSLLALMDINANGRLTLQEFGKLWKLLVKYKDIFRREDENNSGFLDVSSLRRIIQMTGLFIHDRLLQLMAVRYGDSLSRFNFPDFVCCMIRLETMTKVFRNLSKDGTRTTNRTRIDFTENEWITMIMYC